MENSIAIKEISLKNFKGLRNQTVKFNHTTNIFGDNGTGKTTLFDAFTWLLFGKDSTDRKDFEIKTLDQHNNVIPQIEHEVSAVLDVNGETMTIKRILKENWVKKRGSLEAEFSGNVTDYFWNDVPKNQREYQDKISSVLDELVFKLITNPLAFNAIKWQDRREILTQLSPISNSDIEPNNSSYDFLRSMTDDGINDERKKLAAQRKKINDELKNIPTRIDEVSRNTPDALDFESLKAEKKTLEKCLLNFESQIEDRSKAFDALMEARNTTSRELFELKGKIQSIEMETKQNISNGLKNNDGELSSLISELSKKESDLFGAQNALKSLTAKKDAIETEINSLTSKMASKREEWNKVNAETLNFDNEHFDCPTCKRAFDAKDIEAKKADLTNNFKKDQQKRLADINAQGKALLNQKETLENELSPIKERILNGDEHIKNEALEIENLKSKIEHLKNNPKTELKSVDVLLQETLSVNEDYQSSLKKVEELQSKIDETPQINIEDLKLKKGEVNERISNIDKSLNIEIQIRNANKRVEELKAEESALSKEMNEIEKTQFVIDNFIKAKIDTLEERINQKFKYVKFKLFDTQINGGEVECCEALINGVPFSDANNAAKINAGLDIINTLCQFYKVTAPIFIDNRESVVNIVDCQSQIINLIVSEEDKKLRVA